MTINFLPNDPLAVSAAPMRNVKPLPKRPSSRAGFRYTDEAPEALYSQGTPEFLYWQCREAALRAVDVWEDVSGGTFKSWQPGKKLDLLQDDGEEINAFYDRSSLAFFHKSKGTKTYYSGASTDVVAHEGGHGFLDAIRPDFWSSSLFEVNAFHEAFGDCIAILTALYDAPSRTTVRSSISKKNFVETTAEELSKGIKVIIRSDHNAAAPRRARNKFQWALPGTLPDFGSSGDGPGKLINEIHSFGMIFSGCFYDTIVNIYAGGAQSDKGLLKAAQTAGRLLVTAATNAPQKSRYFREVGRHMMIADQNGNGGANRGAIRSAFAGHGIALGSSITLAPEAALAGPGPKLGAKPSLTAAVRRDLSSRLGATRSGKLVLKALKVGKEKLAQVTHETPVLLDKLHKKLKGVIAMAPETVLVGSERNRATIVGAMPDLATTYDEVEAFVRSLIKQGAIDFGDKPKRGVGAVAKAIAEVPVTHKIKTVGGKKMLQRTRFACFCNHRDV